MLCDPFTEGDADVVSGFGDGLLAHRGAGLDADDRDFVGQHRPELAGKNPGARAHIDDQIGGRCLGNYGGKVRNQLIGVARPVLAILPSSADEKVPRDPPTICENRKPFNRKAKGGASSQPCGFFAAAVGRRRRGS
jgi:hypothetical protein